MAALSLCSLVLFSPRGCCCRLRQVAYAFIFWLPFYLSNLNYSDTDAGNISTVYDIGGVAGGIIAGYASDLSGKRGLVSVTMLLLSLPGLWAYSFLAQYGMAVNIVLMFIVSERKKKRHKTRTETDELESIIPSQSAGGAAASCAAFGLSRSLTVCLFICLPVCHAVISVCVVHLRVDVAFFLSRVRPCLSPAASWSTVPTLWFRLPSPPIWAVTRRSAATPRPCRP